MASVGQKANQLTAFQNIYKKGKAIEKKQF